MEKWCAAMRGDRFEAAWALSTEALAERDPATRDDPRCPYHQRWVWDGSDVSGRHVLVRCYHGLGDTIQFARFLPLLGTRAASVTVEMQPRLIALFEGMAGVDRLVPFDPAQPLRASECDLEITELDFALRAPPSAVPAAYLHASRAVLPRGTVGLCYGAGDWDCERCVPPELFTSICERVPCITLVPEPTTLAVRNPRGCPFDMATTASLVAGADLIITVDTMIAHLAGAMGKPTWLLLKAEPDWRWSPHATGSPWYPSMRLYAQHQPGNWQSVLARVARDFAVRTPTKAKGQVTT